MKPDRRHTLALREHDRFMRRLLEDLRVESASLARAGRGVPQWLVA